VNEEITHVLKAHPGPFQALWERRKVAEFRKNDRGYREGHWLALVEYDPANERFSGREIMARVTHVLEGPSEFGMPDGYAMLSLSLRRGCDHGGLAWEIGR
jgi:Domain of unknown function (DUF3850)